MGYSKHETMSKQRKLVSKAQRNKRKVLITLFKVFLVAIITVIIAGAGMGFGMIKGILDNAPDVTTISIIPKGYKTVIYDQNGNSTRELSMADSNREYVTIDQIPEDLVNAFVSIEDERFWTHNGIDVRGILRAFSHGIKSGGFDEGASTITQQLIKNMVFNVGLNEDTFMDSVERKIQEQYLALELETMYSKEQIIEYYLNVIYLGRNCYGVQSAANKYFGKDVSELSISECATIAGITQNPSAFDPVSHPQASSHRREDVLDKMLELGYISQTQYAAAVKDNVYDRIAFEAQEQASSQSVYSYYEDAIIDSLVADFMAIYNCSEDEAEMLVYSGGYQVYSVQDKNIQAVVDKHVNDDSYMDGIERVGLEYRLTVKDAGGNKKNYSTETLLTYFRAQTGNTKFNNVFENEEAARAAADEYKQYVLEQTGMSFVAESFSVSPQPQVSFTIMDQKTGYVKAICGGKGEKTVARALNRATKSARQPGSTFKVLSTFVPYIDTDMGGLATSYKDEKYYYKDGVTEVVNWWGNTSYRGYNNFRNAIRNSMNVITVKAITDVTPEVAYQYLLKLGLTTLRDGTSEDDVLADGSVLTDIGQAMALGGLTNGVTTYEMSAAYASIANGGVYTKPVLYSKVIDHDGNVIIDNTTPANERVMKETTAWQLIDAMRSVVQNGTGTQAKMKYGVDCAGKTGTTNSVYDMWFCGMTPYYTASIWIGYDYNTTLKGTSETQHKRMWRGIMDEIAEMENQDKSAVIMERPEGIETVTLCQITNKLPNEDCPTTTDYMATTAIPTETCSGHGAVAYCLDSNKVATSRCTNVAYYIASTATDPDTGESYKVLDGNPPEGLVYTTEVCTLHPELSYFNVTTQAGEGGSISDGATHIEAGSSVTVFITPNYGYSIEDVKVNGTSVGKVSTYTIAEIASDTVVSVTFTKRANQEEPVSTEGTTEQTTESVEPEAPIE